MRPIRTIGCGGTDPEETGERKTSATSARNDGWAKPRTPMELGGDQLGRQWRGGGRKAGAKMDGCDRIKGGKMLHIKHQ